MCGLAGYRADKEHHFTGFNVRASPSPARWTLPLAAGFAILAIAPTPASAQNVFPCGGGPNEQQIGMDTNGPVAVPLCVERTGTGSGASAAPISPPTWKPTHIPPPRGWKPVFGAWKSFIVSRIPGTDRFNSDYALSLGHSTREDALAAVREQCMAKKPLYAESKGTCEGYVLKAPYITVVQYPNTPSWLGQAGTFIVYDETIPMMPSLVERSPGKWEECGQPRRPAGHCANVVGFFVNGELPASGKKSRRR